MSTLQPPPQTPPPTSHAFTVVEILDDVGRRVIHRQIVLGERPKDFVEFVGVNQIIVRVGGEGGPSQPSAYRFPIEGAKTIEEAFSAWDATANHYAQLHVEELKRQMREAQMPKPGILIPNAADAPRILGARG